VSNRHSTSTRIFLAVTAFLLLADSLFVVLNAYFAREALNERLLSWAIDRRATYDILLDETLESMLVLATVFASDPQLHEPFVQGREAVLREGGGPGGERAAVFRDALLERLQPAWSIATRDFALRQLHFHIGPGSLSFLRVHQPDRYGDRMDNLRHIIVDTIAEGQPRSGFELGRIYSGLRGVVPIFASIGEHHGAAIGALEVGTSYQPLLDTLARRTGSHFAVLLKSERIDRAMWDQFRRNVVALERDDLVVEATTSECIAKIIKRLPQALFEDRQEEAPRIAHVMRGENADRHDQGRWIVVATWPVEDYLSRSWQHAGLPGFVTVCEDVTTEIDAYQRSLMTSVLYAIGAFLALEVFLFFAIRVGTRHLEQRVDIATQSIRELNSELKVRAETDGLTGLLNRPTFFAAANLTLQRVQRQGGSLGVAMIDIDHFKQINDGYGHGIGDKVISAVADVLRASVRDGDLICRYGGEEFLVLVQHPTAVDKSAGPSTPLAVAERIHLAVRDLCIPIDHPDSLLKTAVSIGVTELGPEETIENAIHRADEQLYAAKRDGRDRVCQG
jgi:diguanylate cyclase (GGDEF)-like protein